MSKKPTVSLRRPPAQAVEAFVAGERASTPTGQTSRRQRKKHRKQVTVYLPPDLVKKLKLEALETEKEMSEIAEAALLEHLAS